MVSIPEKHTSIRGEIEGAFGQVSAIVNASLGPVNAAYPHRPSNEPLKIDGSKRADLGKVEPEDIQALLESFHDQARGVQDDSTLLLERLVTGLSRLPEDSKTGKHLTDNFVNTLWDALPHPPLSSLGGQYKYREADGRNNNISHPSLGQAGSHYARSVKPVILQNIQLPDPGDIFDELMDRGDAFEEHPNKISSVLFYMAAIITHDIFCTNSKDNTISDTSSYLDLSPLYGKNGDEQKLIRTFKDGKLKPDCFSEKRTLGLPPGVGVMLIMFNRFHNKTATMLALINENGRFTKPKDDDASKWAKYDEDLFQTSRLITCGLYVNIIVKDYVRTILSLNRTSSTWALDPRSVSTKTMFNVPAPEGVGNSVSAEFNLIYRWHSAISERDDKWIQEEYERIFPGKNHKDMPLHELMGGLGKVVAGLPEDPLERPFGGLTRNKDGTLPEEGLVEILTSSILDVAGSFGANRVPTIMRSIEILGIMQARQWNLASLNEFRLFFGLKAHETFEEINPDPIVAKKLKNLYDSPDFVELYPGLTAEKAKPPQAPGSGLCVNYTISRAILSDAVSLVRGDRFYTTDFNGRALTNWGFTACNFDTKVDQGCVMYKLILGAFPDAFKGNSIYAHFPFVTPAENLVIQTNLDTAKLYDWNPPKVTPEVVSIDSYDAVVKILNDKTNWKVTWGDSIEFLVSQPNERYGDTYCLAGDDNANEESRKLVMKALYPNDWKKEVKAFYQDITEKLLKKYTYQIGGANCVDITRDVGNLAHAHFSASLFSLPLKTEDNPRGIYTEQELSMILSLLFFAIFYDIDPKKSFPLKTAAKMLAKSLGTLVLLNVESVSRFGKIAEFVEKIRAKSQLEDYGMHTIQRLLQSGLSTKEVVWGQLLPTASSMVANQSQLFSQVLDYYLTEGIEHLPRMQEIAEHETDESEDLLLHYFMEGARLRHTAGLFREAAIDMTVQDHDCTVQIPKNHRILANIVRASRDPVAFPDPLKVDVTRPLDSYIHYGYGPHECAGVDASKVAMTTMFRAILRLKGLRLDPANREGVRKVPAEHGYTVYLKPDWSDIWPIPTSLKIRWDGPALV
ncbi:hypothetical protein V499_08898 [Pseudogymnoascus sp. VKM F-103]|nr:hypothetical protein V499_08898 [Pseudogymnoascus sp. VKM F-103]